MVELIFGFKSLRNKLYEFQQYIKVLVVISVLYLT